MTKEWTFDEFQIYVLLYAAHCNAIETNEEYEYIITKFNFDTSVFNKIHTEITMDNEILRLSKIKEYVTYQKLTNHQKENLLRDVKNVFFADGTVDLHEKNAFIELQKLLRI